MDWFDDIKQITFGFGQNKQFKDVILASGMLW